MNSIKNVLYCIQDQSQLAGWQRLSPPSNPLYLFPLSASISLLCRFTQSELFTSRYRCKGMAVAHEDGVR